MPELAYVNGSFMPIEEAVVPIEDRGYLFGDAVYEGIASYNGKLFYLEAHLDRLENSMKALDFPPMSRDRIRTAIVDLFERAGIGRAFIYLQITRGVAPRNHAFSDPMTPQFIMTVRAVREVPPELRQTGASAITIQDYRWGRCDIKTVQLLPNTMAKQKAVAAGAYDAIFVAGDGVVREATSSNLFVVANGTLVTHPLNYHILPGITRLVIIDICRELDLSVEERFYTTDELFAAAEAFLSGTTTEVLPLVKIDDQMIGDGNIGPVSKRLLEALRSRGCQQEA